MTERVHIRRATEEDLPALTAMTQDFNEYLDGVGGGTPPSNSAAIAAAAMERLRPMAFGSDPICTVLMAEREAEAVAYVTFYIGVYMDDALPTLHVADFYVQPTARRLGVGRALMLEVRRIGLQLGATRMFWTVWRKNTEAIRFYKSLGAVVEEESLLLEWRIKP